MLLDLGVIETLIDAGEEPAALKLMDDVKGRVCESLSDLSPLVAVADGQLRVMVQAIGNSQQVAIFAAQNIAARTKIALASPLYQANRAWRLRPNVGITIFSDEIVGEKTLLRRATLALLAAQSAGADAIRFFSPAMRETAEYYARLQLDLHDALEADELVLQYQPQVDASNRLAGLEAIPRLTRNGKAATTTDDLTALAEKFGAVASQIGWWLLENLCDKLAAWAASNRLKSLRVSTKVSFQLLEDPAFADRLIDLLARKGVAATRLNLEITTRAKQRNITQAALNIRQLRSFGVKVCISGFGSGSTSMSWLRLLPIDSLKIDHSLIDEIVDNGRSLSIVSTVFSLGRSLNLSVIAEGIESSEQVELLLMAGCTTFQGRHFGDPMTADALSNWISTRHADCSVAKSPNTSERS